MPQPFPWLAAATIASSLLPLFFGGRGEQQRVTETQVPPGGWQDPMLGVLSPLVADILTRRLSGFGEESSVYSPWIQEIIEMLGTQFPDILAGARTSGGKRVVSGSVAPVGSSSLFPTIAPSGLVRR